MWIKRWHNEREEILMPKRACLRKETNKKTKGKVNENVNEMRMWVREEERGWSEVKLNFASKTLCASCTIRAWKLSPSPTLSLCLFFLPLYFTYVLYFLCTLSLTFSIHLSLTKIEQKQKYRLKSTVCSSYFTSLLFVCVSFFFLSYMSWLYFFSLSTYLCDTFSSLSFFVPFW